VTLPATAGAGRLSLVCPSCGDPLSSDGGHVACTGCGRRWTDLDGIPDFVEDFPYWGEIPLEQMRQINRLAAVGSWRSALLDSTDPLVQRAAGMILNLERANWMRLFSVPRDSQVLDLGAGMGTNSHALALRYRHVVAVEPVRERVEFMRHRFVQEGLHNIQIIRGSAWTLPFPPNTFDLVAMNGVLEWVPEGQQSDPRDCQVRALTEVCRAVRPGGSLYVGIENRFAAGYFLGYPDPHCGLPWVTILPRPIARAYARARGRRDYRNYLYSPRGYRRLLRDAGFADIEFYWAAPSYNHPRYFIPLARNVRDYYDRNHAGHSTGLRRAGLMVLRRSGLLKHADYSFAILARKP
jgi:SAM-dependent methyltransferase